MFDARRLSENKWIRYFAFLIVFGFALLMFLPTMSLNEMFGGSSASYITVNGEEVFTKPFPVYGATVPVSVSTYQFFKDYAGGNDKNKTIKAYLLYQLVKDWDKPQVNQELEKLRQRLLQAITYQLNRDLADDLGIVITDQNLKDFISYSFEQRLKMMYEDAKRQNKKLNQSLDEYKDENRDYEWKEYSSWAVKYLKDIYINSVFLSTLNNGILPTFADMDMQYINQEHKVQIDFGLYTFEQYIQDPAFLNSINEEDLKKYYTETEEKITAEQAVFSSIEKANDAKRDPELFKPAKKNETKDYESKIVTLQSDDDFFKELSSYSSGTLSDVISGKGEEKKYYIFRIISKSAPFSELKTDRTKFKEFVKKYANKNFDKYKESYQKRAQEVMSEFLQTAKSGKMFANIQSVSPKIRNVKTGRTEFFTQDAVEVQLLQEKGKDGKAPPPVSIPEFLETSYYTAEKHYNKEFFKTAFSLSKGELSPKVHTSVVKEGDKQVYFVIRNVDIQKPDLSKPIPFGIKNRFFATVKMTDGYIINNGWSKYIIDKYGYKVKVNPEAVLGALGLKAPKLSSENIEKK